MSRTRPRAAASAINPLHAVLSAEVAKVSVRSIDRYAAAHDASHFLLIPELLVTARNEGDVAAVMRLADRFSTPVTFRSGGTSLSGQGVTEDLLMDVRTHFRGVKAIDGGHLVTCQPGATVRAVNRALQPFGRKFGPDPASEIACTIGGVVANNSSGMCCGTEHNSYRTLASSRFVLPSGTTIDTSASDADDVLRTKEPRLYEGLVGLRDRIRSNQDSLARIQSLFSIKNTMGYGINAFVDYDRPVEILERLLVGSEGTLAFVAEATFRTVVSKPHSATGLLIFSDLIAATEALPSLVAAGFTAIELMDAASLRVAQKDPQAPDELRHLEVDAHAALLVEFQEESEVELARRIEVAAPVISTFPLTTPSFLSSDPTHRAALWRVRKGLFAAVAGDRPAGTTALLEDIAVPMAQLLSTCEGLVELFERHGYRESVIFGHAKDGNLHFMLAEDFADPACLRRYEAFTEDLVSLVLEHAGTLKAEHGTGRMMAPFVERQYGSELYAVMRELKELVDPRGLLNPGVILSEDDAAHTRALKSSPAIESEADSCVECGYCEPTCPSKDLTLTPRQRIVVRREVRRAHLEGNTSLAQELAEQYTYDGLQTCAADGMCQTACPVGIDTGNLVRRLRAESPARLSKTMWGSAAKHWDGATRMGAAALNLASAWPSAASGITSAGRAIAGRESVPSYSRDLPGGGRQRIRAPASDADAVYFPSCTSTLFGPVSGAGVQAAFLELCDRAGLRVAIPEDIPSICCGTPWKSKGYGDGYNVMGQKVLESLRRASRDGQLPVVSDAASCSEGLAVLVASSTDSVLSVVDAVSFVDERVLARLPTFDKLESLTLHPTCSSERLGINDALARVAAAAAHVVRTPDDWGCCGFAGDRGMLHPELTASATNREAAEVLATPASAYASLNRTCEIGMSRATGQDYRHVLEVLAERTRRAVGS